MKRRLLSLAVAGTALLTGLAQAGPQIAEVRGDFYYDKDGALIGHRNADFPENLERRSMSHREKYELMGLQLPSARGALEPRTIFAKPARVDDRPQMSRELVIVKFKDEAPVRLRDGKLRSATKSLAAVDEILGRYPEARVERLFRDVEERILDENKESGERLGGKQLADLNNFYAIRFDTPNELAVTIANELLALDDVETAYLQAPGTTPACADIAPTTPNWTASQNYLDPAPAGLDAEAAWAYHAGGNGYGPGYWVCDLEWQWCYGHEDIDIDVTDVLNGNVGNNTNSMNHGTAVLGEIGACSNSYGMTGMTPDVTLKMADFDAAGSWANNIATADGFLISGEVMLLEIHILGPNSGVTCDPTCTTCPPDPNSQFEFVPVEWDAASFAAIQTAVANGIVVVEAAGNGSMNLDSAVYGGWFNPTTHNSGAIMVGAGVNSTHSPHCWSNAGSRVNFHGYGNGVYTAGYGGLFNQTGCEQDYTSTFSGTSSASPMITGAVASVQGVAKAKYNVTLSPAQIKEALNSAATPQGAPTSRNIGPMPNLVWAINWIEPDMILPTPTGWSFPTVPLASASGTFTSAPLGAAAIPGNVDATYWCAATENASYSFTPTINDPDDRIYYSDVWQVQGIRPNHAPGERTYLLNFGPLNVRGGRQTIRQYIDFDFVEDEWAEGNNEFVRQFIWTGRGLTANATPLLLTPGPYALSSGWGPYYNAEGFQGTSGSTYWYAFGVCPTGTTTDLDVRLNTEAPSNIPQAGWGANVAWSSSGDGLSDFVGFNRNAAAAGTYYASVLNFEATGASNERVEFSADPGSLLGEGTFGPFTLGAN
ncbi:MAG: S8 family serine peptidase, partial [Gemmatimonadetes bacterium]|nr:S8 family serine peptidase [Gemmatimonadota bacterium]